jgi:hypothetical protein
MHVFQRFSHFQPWLPRDADAHGALTGLRGPRRLRITGGEGRPDGTQAGARSAPERRSEAAARTGLDVARRPGGSPARVGAADGETVTTRSSFSRTVEGSEGGYSFEADYFVRSSPNEFVAERSVSETYTRAVVIAPPAPNPPVEAPPDQAEPVAEQAPVVQPPPAAPAAEPADAEPVEVAVVEAPAAESAEPAEVAVETEPETAPVETAPVEAAPVEAPPPEPAPVEPPPVEVEDDDVPDFARSTRRETSFEVVTREGDRVSINLESDRRIERYSSPTENRTSRVFERSLSIEVDGELSASELDDIEKLTGGFEFQSLGSLASYRYTSTVTHEVSRNSLSLSA